MRLPVCNCLPNPLLEACQKSKAKLYRSSILPEFCGLLVLPRRDPVAGNDGFLHRAHVSKGHRKPTETHTNTARCPQIQEIKGMYLNLIYPLFRENTLSHFKLSTIALSVCNLEEVRLWFTKKRIFTVLIFVWKDLRFSINIGLKLRKYAICRA